MSIFSHCVSFDRSNYMLIVANDILMKFVLSLCISSIANKHCIKVNELILLLFFNVRISIANSAVNLFLFYTLALSHFTTKSNKKYIYSMILTYPLFKFMINFKCLNIDFETYKICNENMSITNACYLKDVKWIKQ